MWCGVVTTTNIVFRVTCDRLKLEQIKVNISALFAFPFLLYSSKMLPVLLHVRDRGQPRNHRSQHCIVLCRIAFTSVKPQCYVLYWTSLHFTSIHFYVIIRAIWNLAKLDSTWNLQEEETDIRVIFTVYMHLLRYSTVRESESGTRCKHQNSFHILFSWWKTNAGQVDNWTTALSFLFVGQQNW